MSRRKIKNTNKYRFNVINAMESISITKHVKRRIKERAPNLRKKYHSASYIADLLSDTSRSEYIYKDGRYEFLVDNKYIFIILPPLHDKNGKLITMYKKNTYIKYNCEVVAK